MSDAVIISAARTPIGRARKGSLVDARPDDLVAFADRRRAEAGPRARPGRDRRRDGRVRVPRAEAGHEPRAARGAPRRPAGERPGDDRQPVLRLVAADDPHGVSRDQSGRGRRLRRRRRRVDHAGRRLPEGRRGAAPEAVRRRRADRERLHPDGDDRRERRRALGRLPRGHGPLRAALPGAGGGGAGQRVLRPRAHSVERRVRRRRAAPRLDAREARRARAGLPAGRQGHGRKLVPA